MNILLVDDESTTLQALTQTLPWNQLGFEMVYTAQTVTQALEIVRQCTLSVVVTDIRMPGMFGLELIHELHKIQPHVRAVILTGFSDFQYMQAAIRLQADAYLLKPASNEDIVSAILTAKTNYDKRLEEVASIQRAELLLKTNLPLLRNHLFIQLLKGAQYSRKSLIDQLKLLALDQYEGWSCALAIISVNASTAAAEETDMLLKEYAISNIVNDFFASTCTVFTCRESANHIVCFVLSQKTTSLADLYLSIQDAIRSTLALSVSIGVSNWGVFPSEVHQLYRQAGSLLNYTSAAPDELIVISQETTGFPLDAPFSLNSLYCTPSLYKLINAKQWDDALLRIHTAFGELCAAGDNKQELQMEIWHYLTALVLRILHEQGLSMDMLPDIPNVQNTSIPVSDMEAWVCSSLLAIRKMQTNLIDQMRTDIITKIQTYVHEHMQDDTSLQSAADSVHMHPVYLSRIYKLQTGESLGNYILRTKMAKATELLLAQGDAKIYAIAQQLGYSSSAYFGRVFKKYYQMTPQEYRAMHMNHALFKE